MGSAWFVLGLLACPLGMAAMGGLVWLGGKLGWGRTSTGEKEALPKGDHVPTA